MARIAGVEVPNEKPIEIALTYIHGVGRATARKVLGEAAIGAEVRAGKLSEDELSRLSGVIDKSCAIEGQLRRQVAQNIARLRDIGCYRGIRHRRGLPVRGQHTRTNARTRKGPAKTIAGKKGPKARK
jgi:small subunit ribosomal protein S13